LLLREEIAHTVATPGDIEDELRHLIAVLEASRIAEFYGVQRESTRDFPTMTTVLRICRTCGGGGASSECFWEGGFPGYPGEGQ